MSQTSKIGWTEVTWGPTRGCRRVSSGCERCYAERIAARYSRPGLPFHGYAETTPSGPRWTGRVELIEEKLTEPLRWRKPRLVFVNSMSDLFHESLSDEAIERVFAVMALAPRHVFQILSKRPERMKRWFESMASPREGGAVTPHRKMSLAVHEALGGRSPELGAVEAAAWPLPNVWLAVSCEDQKTADERIPHLLATPASVRFVSFEPLLSPIRLDDIVTPIGNFGEEHRDALRCDVGPDDDGDWNGATLDWVIVGGESGPGYRRCDPEWIRLIHDQCQAAGVPCYVKQGSGPRSGQQYDVPDDLWACKEMPR